LGCSTPGVRGADGDRGAAGGTGKLGAVIAGAMVINLLAAALAGIFVPLGLDRSGFDPAVSSTVFVTTVTDVVGFFAFLGLATVWLM
jgi:magnesium transporter